MGSWAFTNIGANATRDNRHLIEAFFDCCGYTKGAQCGDYDLLVDPNVNRCVEGWRVDTSRQIRAEDADLSVILDALFPGTDLYGCSGYGSDCSNYAEEQSAAIYSPSCRQIRYTSRYGFECSDEGVGMQWYNDREFDENGFDEDGYDKDGFNRDGISWNGKPRSEYNAKSYDSEGYDPFGYDEYGKDKEGLDLDGGGFSTTESTQPFTPAAPDPEIIRELIERSVKLGQSELTSLLLELLHRVGDAKTE